MEKRNVGGGYDFMLFKEQESIAKRLLDVRTTISNVQKSKYKTIRDDFLHHMHKMQRKRKSEIAHENLRLFSKLQDINQKESVTAKQQKQKEILGGPHTSSMSNYRNSQQSMQKISASAIQPYNDVTSQHSRQLSQSVTKSAVRNKLKGINRAADQFGSSSHHGRSGSLQGGPTNLMSTQVVHQNRIKNVENLPTWKIRARMVNQINAENEIINQKLQAVKSQIPMNQEVRAQTIAKMQNYRVFASRHKGKLPKMDPLITKKVNFEVKTTENVLVSSPSRSSIARKYRQGMERANSQLRRNSSPQASFNHHHHHAKKSNQQYHSNQSSNLNPNPNQHHRILSDPSIQQFVSLDQRLQNNNQKYGNGIVIDNNNDESLLHHELVNNGGYSPPPFSAEGLVLEQHNEGSNLQNPPSRQNKQNTVPTTALNRDVHDALTLDESRLQNVPHNNHSSNYHTNQHIKKGHMNNTLSLKDEIFIESDEEGPISRPQNNEDNDNENTAFARSNDRRHVKNNIMRGRANEGGNKQKINFQSGGFDMIQTKQHNTNSHLQQRAKASNNRYNRAGYQRQQIQQQTGGNRQQNRHMNDRENSFSLKSMKDDGSRKVSKNNDSRFVNKKGSEQVSSLGRQSPTLLRAIDPAIKRSLESLGLEAKMDKEREMKRSHDMDLSDLIRRIQR